MTISPIIKAKLNRYIEDYELKDISVDEAFERFVNYHVLSQQYPGVFNTDNDLLDIICVGNGNDLGIDGIAVSLNGRLIRDIGEIDDILSTQRRGIFEITFIQSKNKEKYDLGEYMKFTNGVLDFVNEDIKSPFNDEIKKWHEIFKYILSEKIITKWENSPVINLIYCSLGNWEKNEHFLGHKKNVENVLENKCIFDKINFQFVDSKTLNDIVNDNELCYTSVINVIDSMPLPQVDGVDNSSVIMCAASELLDLLTYEGTLRRSIFVDNVRDYQGDTSINIEIGKTLKENAQEFVLLNNGITIVCDEMREVNRKITVKNPQVVNGCQTCNVLYNSWKKGNNVNNAYVIIKVIASSDYSIVNNIIKGTNRQNIVYDEAFEVTKDFHKYLEEYFKVTHIEGFEKIYYERRSKQFDRDETVSVFQKAGFRIIIQSFVSIFLYKVEEGHHHESRLLQDYGKNIFLEEQSYKPYYLSAFLYLQLDKMFRRKQLDKQLMTYRFHVLLILKEMLGGKSPNINLKKDIEKYCDSIEKKLKDYDSLLAVAQNACKEFRKITDSWIRDNGESAKYHIKDNPMFTKYMLESVRNTTDVVIENVTEKVLCGEILNLNKDKNGLLFGFIKMKPNNIYFNEKDNQNITQLSIGDTVKYDILKKNGRQYAVNVESNISKD